MPTSYQSMFPTHDGASLRVFVDANIWIGKTTTDWLYYLNKNNPGLCVPLTSKQVLVEAAYNLMEQHGHIFTGNRQQKAQHVRPLVDDLVEKLANVETIKTEEEEKKERSRLWGEIRKDYSGSGFVGVKEVFDRFWLVAHVVDRNNILESFPPDMDFSGADLDDYHVHAAATTLQAAVLLTNNHPQDFTNNETTEVYTIRSADDFLSDLAAYNPAGFHAAIAIQDAYITRLRKQNKTARPLNKMLQLCGCHKLAHLVTTTTTTQKQHPLNPPQPTNTASSLTEDNTNTPTNIINTSLLETPNPTTTSTSSASSLTEDNTSTNMMDTSLLDDLNPTTIYPNQPQQKPPHPHHTETPNQHRTTHNHQPEL